MNIPLISRKKNVNRKAIDSVLEIVQGNSFSDLVEEAQEIIQLDVDDAQESEDSALVRLDTATERHSDAVALTRSYKKQADSIKNL